MCVCPKTHGSQGETSQAPHPPGACGSGCAPGASTPPAAQRSGVCRAACSRSAFTCAWRAAAAASAALSPTLTLAPWPPATPPVLLLPGGERGRGGGLGFGGRVSGLRAGGSRACSGLAPSVAGVPPQTDAGREATGENASPDDRYSSDRMTASWRGDSSGEVRPPLRT